MLFLFTYLHGLTVEEINILACLFTCIGDNLALIASTCIPDEEIETIK